MHWLAEMVLDYRKRLMDIEFFQHVKNSTKKEDFAWARYLLHQSYEFPLILSLRYSLCKDAKYRQYFAVHADEEYGHCDMLQNWMVRHGLMGEEEEVNAVPPTVETMSAISYFYRQVITEDELAQLVGLNAVSEGIAADFFSTLAPIVKTHGMGDEYWDIHAEVDVEHSEECLTMFPEIDRDSALGIKLARIVHESFVLNGYMLNSWIGIRATMDTTGLNESERQLVVA
ncbi:iron-containing redox enzyme family protein [Tumebacillus sp. DT12]|uniref:Iron-containing redox enzyme family protein n=1 Tax=Tumebacillus lacus TaxID=2995335 RepID=A0ABT3X1H0_9BACL|nr:iron-containing redox enzyme family protein [Tumebacillus lacus]MCX7570766.1 iron-containing redox enzyme family protein [Tumebacillus lacus]